MPKRFQHFGGTFTVLSTISLSSTHISRDGLRRRKIRRLGMGREVDDCAVQTMSLVPDQDTTEAVDWDERVECMMSHVRMESQQRSPSDQYPTGP